MKMNLPIDFFFHYAPPIIHDAKATTTAAAGA